ncbi:MAG: gamma-glutamyltransferase [Beijerinckiaceae bacterium]|nr:gamma-glutamyltransferase [Beijerinckiaceae bacterium]
MGKLKAVFVAVLVVFATFDVSSAQSVPDPIVMGDARTLPVVARSGMVVSQEARASRIGVDILKAGGNAVDAAVATGFALAVTLPRAGNLGGGGFMLVHLAKERKTIAIDYRETAPAAAAPDMFLDPEGRFVPRLSQSSGAGVGVPGTVAGFALALEKYGSGRFTLADLLAPAIALAREGLDVDDDLAFSLAVAGRRLSRYASTRAIFMRPDGAPFEPGDRLVQKDLAASLQRIAASGAAGFYEGETAQKLVAAVQAEGGAMTLEDLKAYRAVERDAVRGTYRGHEIASMPPPSSGGVHVIQILNILERFPLRDLGQNSAAAIHLMAEAMKRAYADREIYLGDPDFVRVPVAGLVSKDYAASLAAKISTGRATPSDQISAGRPPGFESDQTTHYSVVDRHGNAVSNTYTLNFSYGLGLVADGTGVILNNELDDFAAVAGAPNAYGLRGGAANAPGPRKRPLSSMSPAMVFRDGELELVTGSPGGSRIITIVLQIISNVIDHGLNVAEASEAVRVHHQLHPDELRVERGLSIDTIRLLEAKGHIVRQQRATGSTQTIQRRDGVLYGAADTRQRGTAAIGY